MTQRLLLGNEKVWIIVHGLWQWPGRRSSTIYKSMSGLSPRDARSMVQKKLILLSICRNRFTGGSSRGRILRDARAVCFTTEEERLLGQRRPSLSLPGKGNCNRVGV